MKFKCCVEFMDAFLDGRIQSDILGGWDVYEMGNIVIVLDDIKFCPFCGKKLND